MAHITRTLAALALGLAAAPACARQLPNPPPSGIVIHLFGPNSVTSHIMPATPQAAPGTTRAATPTSSEPTAATPAAPSPTFGDIAHQLFVTGNPAQEGPAALPKGKTGQ